MAQKRILSGVSVLIAALVSNPGSAATIYDNTGSTFTNGGAFSALQQGNEVVPAGTARVVTALVIGIDLQDHTGSANLEASLYANDGTGGQPGTLLWQSALMQNVPLSGSSDLITFAVPNVLVPDAFTWTMQTSNATPLAAGLPIYGAPSIGSSTAFWFGSPGSWTKSPSLEFALAQIIATTVPEPSSMILLCVGLSVTFAIIFIRQLPGCLHGRLHEASL
jgi:hypothetical protein